MESSASSDAGAALENLDEIAVILLKALRTSVPVPPVIKNYPGVDISSAYGVQRRIVDELITGGARRVGWKVGLTSRAMQVALGVNEPDFGVLLDSMAAYDGEQLRCENLIQPKVEAEFAFRLREPLRGPGVDLADVLRAVDAVAPSIEVIDSRILDWNLTIVDTVADLASSARFVIGEWSPIDTLDLRLAGALLTVDGSVVATGAGGAVLEHPAQAVGWLANTIAAFGEQLEEGDVVLSGAVHAAVPVEPGSRVVAEFDRLGSVAVEFLGKEY